ncbi:MAG: hypothetical protein QW727_03955 [Candidatus Pacearchaeota archaeon]
MVNLFKSKSEYINNKDVGYVQDFIFLIKNLYAFENHCLSSYSVTKDKIQLELAMKARRIRSKWMYKIIPESKNQIYCEIKHASGISMALIEIGNRHFEMSETELAKEAFQDAGEWEAIFILLSQNGDKNV